MTIGSFEFDNNPCKEEIVEQILTFDSRNYLRRNYDIVYPSIDVVVNHDGQRLQIGDSTMTFYRAPGHTICGIFCIVEPQGIFLAGDYLSNIEFPFIYYDSKAYEKTLNKVNDILEIHKVKLLVPGHGQYTTDVSEIHLRQQRSLDYIQTMREHLRANRQQDIDRMLYEYEFPLGMRTYHENNQVQLKKELGID